MDAVQSSTLPLAPPDLPYLDRVFSVAKKTTVIQLRWPLVILCAYLLLYSPAVSFTPVQTEALLIFYLLTNATLYFVADEYFDLPHFYGPLLVFDVAFLALVLAVSGGASPDFYVACCLTLVLSCICNDARGLVVVTILAPLLYGYTVFNSTGVHHPSLYLRVLFPLVISMFFGYFAQVERLRRVARENQEHARRECQAAEEIQRQRERIEVLQAVSVADASNFTSPALLDVFLGKTLARLPYAAAILQLRNLETGIMETAAVKGIEADLETVNDALKFVDEITKGRTPVVIRNCSTDVFVEKPEFYKRDRLQSLIAVPLMTKSDRLGALVLLTREEHHFTAEEIGFLATLAGQTAMAIHNSRLFAQIHQQANELRHANKVKDDFLGVVSHELRTPLNVISGYTHMLIERMLGDVSPIQEKALQTVAQQSKELHELINRVLQVSIIEAHMLQAEFHEVNIWELLAELRAFYDYPLQKDVNLIWEFLPDLPTVRADRGKLRHILENLINNAIKFTDKGSVTISAQYVPAKQWVEFKVADTGIGIPNDQLPLIFEKFRQLDGSETRSYGGVGLGLYIVSQYTAIVEGTIEVESQPGQGTTFSLRIPSKIEKAAAVPEQLSFAPAVENV